MADERPGGPPATPAIGAVPLPPGYVLVEKLGSGGFATVWLAEQGQLGRRVAVKLLGETLEDSERERRFLAECRAIGRLSGHPAVVTVHDAGTTDAGHPYLVMEHLPGGSLHDRMHREGPLPWPEVLDVGVHVADALAAAHEAGILHRDIKPANVLLDANGSPKLGDFGIARLSEGTNTATGVLVGTIPFTPPEVLSGHRPGPTADVWALGATLHTLLTRKSPFSGDRDEPPAATIARVLRSEAPPLGPDVPAALRDLIADMLRPEPRDRPPEAVDVVARLQAIQAERGLPVTPARSTRVAPAPSRPIGIDDATVAGAALATTPPPSPPSVVPPPPPPPGPRPDLAKAGEPDPDAATVSGPFAAAPPPPPAPPAPSGHPAGASPAADPPTVVGPAAPPAAAPDRPIDPATSVMPVYDPGRPAPAAGAPSPPPPGPSPSAFPPPPGRPGRSERRAAAPILVGVAVLVVLVLVAGVAIALLGGSDDGGEAGDDPGTGTTAADTTDDAGAPVASVDSPVGAPLAVPSGLASPPATPAAWDVAASCADSGCTVIPADGDVVVLRTDPDGTRTVERHAAATDEVRWSLRLDGVTGQAGLAWRGGLVIVSSSSETTRTYRGIADGQLVWSTDLAQDDGPVFPGPQASERYGVLELGNVGAYAVLDFETGVAERGEGRVLATDRSNVYVSAGGRIEARSLAGGDVVWQAAEDLVSAAPVDAFPAWRYGVVADDVLVVVTDTEVVALNRESGAEVWDARVPVSDAVDELGTPFAVSNVGGVVVVVAEGGDLGVDARTGTLVWREVRDRLVYAPDLDDAAMDAARGTPVWIGVGDRLLVGWTGAHLQLLDVTTGEIVSRLDLEPTGGRSAMAIGGDAIAILRPDGTIAAYGYESLDAPLWESTAYPAVTGLAAVDGGLAVVDPSGIHGLQG